MVTHTKPLIVYKASAGSGKTFTLATEYIKLVVRNPQAYRQILAVTFTNKATEEMKMRILSQLYGIWRRLPDSDRYASAVAKELKVTPDYVARQAGVALTLLLHNYSYFRVETIDSFFQSVLRNLARELDLTANLRVSLNDSQVEELAVDQLIENLSAQDLMLQWLLRYIMENISDNRSWNVISQIKQFGKTIFRDYYKQQSGKLYAAIGEKDFFDRYTAQLHKVKNGAQKRMTELADAFFSALGEAGFTVADLSYGEKGVASFFLKLRKEEYGEDIVGKRVQECLESADKWMKKTHPQRDALRHLAESTLMPLLCQAVDERPRQWCLYQSARLTLRHLSQLRLLDSIERKVRQLNADANCFLLSDTQQLLSDLIEGSDSPFIFEKMGTQLENIMIDEFQDTSTVQWQNFKVLLQETMSHTGTENLIVGDVKQSIYRWRSGDWRLLAGIMNQFANSKELIDVRTLGTNYRSSAGVVHFNNAFFTEAAMIEDVSAYDDVTQEVPEGRTDDGCVRVQLFPARDYQQQMLDAIISQVGILLEAHVPASDIAILVRVNSQIPLIARYFMEQMPEVRIVSDEAFRLDASPAVMVIICALRLLVQPEDQITKAFLAAAWSGQPLHTGHLDEKLPEAFCAHTGELLRLPLYELTERLFEIFHLYDMEGQTAYLCAFYDQVARFASEQIADVPSLLNEWDENLCKKTVQCTEAEGIRLISIHKSKGLEYPYVIMPFCDWLLEQSDILWCKPSGQPFGQLPLAPIDYSQSGMIGTIYEEAYNEEHRQNVVDNLNLLYVGFTRASKGLYIYGMRNGAANRRSMLIEQVLLSIVPQLPGSQLTGEADKEQPLAFSFGALRSEERDAKCEDGSCTNGNLSPLPSPISHRKEENVFLQESQPIEATIEVFTQKTEFRQSNRSRDFAATDDDEQQRSYIQLGSILHEIFSTIRTAADIAPALRQLEMEGVIANTTIETKDGLARLETMIRRRLDHPRVADWFSPRWTLYNECTILVSDPLTGTVTERRPDRVMTDGKETIVVDFKFGHPRDEYYDQVIQYMQLLTQMGHPRISGYLWFVYSNKVVEVMDNNTI